MKLLCIILSVTTLLTGCYSHEVIENNAIPTPNLDNVEVTFELHDGSSIISLAGEEHSRIEGGYRIVGKLNSNQLWNTTSDFDGIVRDEQIKDITVSELNSDSIVVGGAVLVLGCIVALVIWSDFEVSFRGSTP